MDPGDDAQHGRALLGARRNLRREARVLREFDEDRTPGVQSDGRARAGLCDVRLPDRRPADHARHRRIGEGRRDPQGAPADVDADRVRALATRSTPLKDTRMTTITPDSL